MLEDLDTEIDGTQTRIAAAQVRCAALCYAWVPLPPGIRWPP